MDANEIDVLFKTGIGPSKKDQRIIIGLIIVSAIIFGIVISSKVINPNMQQNKIETNNVK